MRLLRAAALSSLALMTSCSATPAGGGALQVLVELAPGVTSRCVKVIASDGATARETAAMPLDMQAPPLRVAVFGEGFPGPVRVRAAGFSDAACTTSSGETSEQVEGTFGKPPPSVTLTLRPAPSSQADGGMNGGLDAGLDQDGDGFPVGVDCNDDDPTIHPRMDEGNCGDSVDNNCGDGVDCADPSCASRTCPLGGQCLGGICVGAEVCNDRADNDGNGATDCLDPACAVGASCNDGDFCTQGETCVADGGCQKAADFGCTMPPGDAQCFTTPGTCTSDGGALCSYAVKTNATCSDGLACTTGEQCNAGGACTGGTALTCTPPSNTCLEAFCAEPGGCAQRPLGAGSGTCSDGDPCTRNDTCDGDGGCRGAMQTCTPPSQCHQFNNACMADGTCLFDVLTGQACDAGAGMGAATCAGSGTCTVTPATLFPYTPTSFLESQLPATDGGAHFLVACSGTIDTSGSAPTTDAGCLTLPPHALITPDGGTSTVLFAADSFTVQAGHTLTIVGSRPVIFAVLGTATVDGTVRVRAGADAAAACGAGLDSSGGGGGGGGFGTDGGVGGTNSTAGGRGGGFNGLAALAPIRGGCNGGRGSPNAPGGLGGGGFQLAVAGSLNVTGVITASGRGGAGALSIELNGGGGGSGGGVLLEGNLITLSATAKVTANGGGGGGGEDGNNGQPGTPGSETTSTPAAGGAPGGGQGGRGGNGAAGATGAEGGFGPTTGSDGAGGGGGGVGRIRLNARMQCTLTSGRVISPPHTSGGSAACN